MKKLLLLSLVLVCATQLKAQDPEFTQFYANPLYLNPAFAGTAKGARFISNFRNQWPSLSSNFITYSASYDQHFDAIGGGIGIQVLYDRAGDGLLSTTIPTGIYSHHLNVTDEFTIKAGLQASVYMRSIDFTKLRFGDMIHPKRGFILPTAEEMPDANRSNGKYATDPFVDFSAGALGFTENFFAGFAVHHITEPNLSFYNTPKSPLHRKFTAHAGMMIPLEEGRRPSNFISPNILIMRQGEFTQVNFGAYIIQGPFIAGAWFRQTPPNSDALMALIGVKKDVLKVGYSYDLTLSSLKAAGKGSHEVSLIVEIPPVKRNVRHKWRDLNCPDF
jgi:type IX secretion system PorP/SprF family membrane protein